jgi:hypothetical protein
MGMKKMIEKINACEKLELSNSMFFLLDRLCRIELLSYTGNVLKIFNNVKFCNGTAKLDIHEIPKGEYLLRIRDRNLSDIIKLKVDQYN